MCVTSFMEGLLCGASETQPKPNLKQFKTTSSFPKISPLTPPSISLNTRFRSSGAKIMSFHSISSFSLSNLPVSNSSKTIPKEYTSHFQLGFRFCKHSGAWYRLDKLPPRGLGDGSSRLLCDNVDLLLFPRYRKELPAFHVPEVLCPLFDATLSTPKSPSIASISGPRRILLGFRLPWTTFFSWR